METSTVRTGAFYKIIIWVQTIIVTPFVHLFYYDIQLAEMNKQVNKEEKKLDSKWKSINLGYCNDRTCYVWVKQSTESTELISRYNWLWKQIVGFVILYFKKILIAHIFEKHTKKSWSLRTQFKIEFLLLLTDHKSKGTQPFDFLKPSIIWKLAYKVKCIGQINGGLMFFQNSRIRFS